MKLEHSQVEKCVAQSTMAGRLSTLYLTDRINEIIGAEKAAPAPALNEHRIRWDELDLIWDKFATLDLEPFINFLEERKEAHEKALAGVAQEAAKGGAIMANEIYPSPIKQESGAHGADAGQTSAASPLNADELIERCAELADQDFQNPKGAGRCIRALKGRFTLAAPSQITDAHLLTAWIRFKGQRGFHEGEHDFCCENGRCRKCEESYVREESLLDGVFQKAADAKVAALAPRETEGSK
jgi:hypothetical protein